MLGMLNNGRASLRSGVLPTPIDTSSFQTASDVSTAITAGTSTFQTASDVSTAVAAVTLASLSGSSFVVTSGTPTATRLTVTGLVMMTLPDDASAVPIGALYHEEGTVKYKYE